MYSRDIKNIIIIIYKKKFSSSKIYSLNDLIGNVKVFTCINKINIEIVIAIGQNFNNICFVMNHRCFERDEFNVFPTYDDASTS